MASSPVIIQVATPGPAGPAGPGGATGPAGYSPRYYVQAGVPTSGVGLAGDMYINSTNSDVWGPKIDNTTWPATPACNIRGIAGYSPLYIVAAGAPSGALGNNGDMYINSTTSDLYGPKSAGGWGPIVANLKGATGSTGAQGPPGVSYTPRGAWSSITTYAQGDQVTDVAILYIGLQSGNLNHVPASSPTWWQAVASGGTQTPWASDIDGNSKKLNNASAIGIGVAAGTRGLSIAAGSLATAAGSSVTTRLTQAFVTNNDELTTTLYRATAGSQWDSALWRIQRTVDSSSNIEHIDFGKARLAFAVGGTEKCVIDLNGVGLGVIAPTANLEINDAIASDTPGSAHKVRFSWGGTPIFGWRIGSGNAALVLDYLGSGWTAGINIHRQTGVVAFPNGKVCVGNVVPQGNLSVNPAVNAVSVVTATQLTLGEVTNTPGYYLSAGLFVDAGVWKGSVQTIVGGSAGPLILNGIGGNVGIGTANPTYVLDVAGIVNASAGFRCLVKGNLFGSANGAAAAPATTDANILLYQNSSVNWAGIGSDTNGSVWVRTGTSGTPDARLLIAADGKVGIAKLVPAYALDVTGDVNCTGTYRVNGTPIGGGTGITVQSVVTASRVLGTVYQNTTGKPVMATVSVQASNGGGLVAVTDSSTTPTTGVAVAQNNTATATSIAITFWVLPGNYYKVYSAIGTVAGLLWTEWY